MNLPNSFYSLKIGLSEAIPKIKSLFLLWPSIFFNIKYHQLKYLASQLSNRILFKENILKSNFDFHYIYNQQDDLLTSR